MKRLSNTALRPSSLSRGVASGRITSLVNIADRPWIQGGVLALLVLLVYWPTLNNQFISDDTFYVRDNAQLDTLDGLRKIWFTTSATPQYYPVVHTVLWGEYRLWKLDARAYHAVNICLHLLVVLVFWRLLLRLRVPGAWFAAAVFGIHPVHVETVAWISEQKNLLSCLAGLGAILAYLQFARPEQAAGPPGTGHGSWGWYGLTMVLYLVALGSKTIAVSVPAVVLVILWWRDGRLDLREAARLAPLFLIGVALSLLTVRLERTNVGAAGPEWEHTFVERLLIAARAIWFYTGKLAWPYPLKFTYPRWQIDARDWRQWCYLFAALGVVGGAWLGRRSIGRGPLAAALLFGGILLPAIGFFDVYPFLFSFVADHYVYHASGALIVLFSAGLVCASRRVEWGRWPLAAVAGTVLVLLAILARQETYDYYDDRTLIEDSIRDNAQSWAAQFRYATLLTGEKRHAAALKHYMQAAKLFPQHAKLHSWIAYSLAKLGRPDEARREYERALTGKMFEEDAAFAHRHLAELLSVQGLHAPAVEHYRAAIALDPDDATTRHNCGVALRATGELQEATDMVQSALKIDPHDANAQHTLGSLLIETGRSDEALTPLLVASRAVPDDAGFRLDLAMHYYRLQRYEEAARELHVILRQQPAAAGALNLLGAIKARQGRMGEAIEHFEAALRVDPSDRSAAENLRKAREAPPTP